MKPQAPSPALYHIRGKDLPISRAALLELMREVLARGIPFRFRARGWSMTPFIRDGDVVRVAPLRRSAPALGEVVAFIHPDAGEVIVHRVIGRRGASCLIQGDNAPSGADGFVPGENILGRVTRVEREGRVIWLGLGPERYLIALLSRSGLLLPLRLRLGLLWRALGKRSVR